MEMAIQRRAEAKLKEDQELLEAETKAKQLEEPKSPLKKDKDKPQGARNFQTAE